MKMLQLYPPDSDNALIKTGQGSMRYIDFLRAEKNRIEQNPKRVAKLVRRLGFSWLMVNKITRTRSNNGQSYRQLMPMGQRKVRAI